MMQKETAPSWLSGLDLPKVSALVAIAFPRTDVLASSVFFRFCSPAFRVTFPRHASK